MENIGNQEKESAESVTQQAGQPRRVLVVGAGGFVGGYFVEEGLRRGLEVWAGVRASTRLDRFTDPRIKFVKFDFDEPASLVATLREALPEGRWDYVIYNLGATKVLKYADFNRINYEYLRAFTGALHESGKVPERLLYMSSLSVVGPQGEKDYAPLTEDMIPRPNTRYGASKLKAELWLATAGIPYVIFRATGVYGPWDKDYLLEFESMRKGFDFGVGFRRQMLTFIFARTWRGRPTTRSPTPATARYTTYPKSGPTARRNSEESQPGLWAANACFRSGCPYGWSRWCVPSPRRSAR